MPRLRHAPIDLCPHGEPKGKHDCIYVSAREALIPLAEREANKVAGAEPKPGLAREAWVRHWDRTFHDAMTRLWAEHGDRLYVKLREDARRVKAAETGEEN